MGKHTDNERESPARHGRSRALTVFAAALVAGGAAALGVNRLLELHLERVRPRVECEPIFVSLRSLPSGAAVTVWDVGLREWPKAMVPAAAVRSIDSFNGLVARHPLREGQPLLAVQLSFDPDAAPGGTPPATTLTSGPTSASGDLWLPAETTASSTPAPAATRSAPAPAAPVTPPTQATIPDPVPMATVPVAAPVAAAAPPPAAAPVVTATTVTGTTPPAAPTARTPADVDPPAVAAVTPPAADPIPSAPSDPTAPPPSATGAVAVADAAGAGGAGGPTATAIAAGGGLRPLLPTTWAPSTLRSIIVPQRIALKAEDDTAAAVAAAVNSSPQRRGRTVVVTSSTAMPRTEVAAGQSPPTSPVTRIAAAPELSSPLRTAAPDQGAGGAAPQDARRSAAAQKGGQPAPKTGVSHQPAAPSRPRQQPAPSRGFRLPTFFDWSK